MSMKEFFKPTKKKTIVSFILSLTVSLSIFLILYQIREDICLIHADFTGQCIYVIPSVPIERLIIGSLIIFLISFLIFYVLSCLTVWIYNKLKKRK